MLVDNGKDFRSEWFAGSEWKSRRLSPEKGAFDVVEGVLQECNTRVHFATPYRGQSKPVERFFRTVCEMFSKSREFYVGSNTKDSPESKKLYWGGINGRDKIEVTYTLEKLREDFAQFVEWFNSSHHHTGQGMDGKTPNEVFAENFKGRRTLEARYRKYIFAAREKRMVQRNGVCVDGINYYNPKMARFIGEKVEVRRDINDIGKVAIFSLPDIVYLFDAESDFFKDRGIAEEQLRRVRGVQKKAREHIERYPRSEEIRRAKKTPAELLALQEEKREENEMKKAAGDENIPVKIKRKRHFKLLTDPE